MSAWGRGADDMPGADGMPGERGDGMQGEDVLMACQALALTRYWVPTAPMGRWAPVPMGRRVPTACRALRGCRVVGGPLLLPKPPPVK
jgi:hypothetical protein